MKHYVPQVGEEVLVVQRAYLDAPPFVGDVARVLAVFDSRYWDERDHVHYVECVFDTDRLRQPRLAKVLPADSTDAAVWRLTGQLP